MLDYQKMIMEVDKYFDDLSDEQYTIDKERAAYDFYKNINVSILSPMPALYSYLASNIPTAKIKFDKIPFNYKKVDILEYSDEYDIAA